MARRRNLRRRSASLDLKFPQVQVTADPASPPDTPTASPLLFRKKNPSPFYVYANSLAQDPNIRPYGNGHQFSYRPLESLSPRSSPSSSSSEAVVDSTNDESSDSASIVSLPNSPAHPLHVPMMDEQSVQSQSEESDADSESDAESDSESESEAESDSGSELGSEKASVADDDELKQDIPADVISASVTELCDFTIEDVDPMDSECEGLDVLFPTEIESNRSRSRSRHKDLDKGMMHDLRKLNCSNETSDNEADNADGDFHEIAFLRRRQELKRIRRVSMSSSFGKRTHSELSDSDENDMVISDVNEVGSSARRFRKRLHRSSILFHDPPEPRIDELEEPNSSEDEYAAELALAQELPYYSMDIMEMESS